MLQCPKCGGIGSCHPGHCVTHGFYDPAPAGFTKCTRCGATIPHDASFCECGEAVASPPRRPAPAPSSTASPPATAGRGTKRCPYCAEEIQAAAVKCRFCGSMLSPTEVPRPSQLAAPPPPAPVAREPTVPTVPMSPGGLRCPSCGSSNVQSLAAQERQKKSSGMGCVVMLLVLIVLLLAPGLVCLPLIAGIVIPKPYLFAGAAVLAIAAIAKFAWDYGRYVCLVCNHEFKPR